MKKRGFTLTEVLITLGIIGIVAALVAPTLIQNGQNEANAAKLATTVANMENAFAMALETEHADSLYDTQMWANAGNFSEANGNAFYGELSRYMKLNGIRFNRNNYSITSIQGQTINNGHLMPVQGNVEYIIQAKNGALIFVQPLGNIAANVRNEATIRRAGGALFERAADVIIDTNGTSAPNMVGRDVFTFILGSDGTLYPYGGRDVSLFNSSGTTANNTWDRGNNFACPNNVAAIQNPSQDGEGCTARVIANGYKIDY